MRRLFLHIGLHIVWWDIILARGPLRRFRRPATPRWAALATRFRRDAEALGGVLIKLGQFVSSRVDLLPAEVTDILAELHDAVPPAPLADVVAQLEAEFGRPLGEVFPVFEPVALGAASLAQAHRARLANGRPVVVKVLRPGIEEVVESDLKVVGRSIRRLRFIGPVRRRVDIDVLADEFVSVTRDELDLTIEAENARRFAADFAADPEVATPEIFPVWSGRRTITMEDVAWFSVQDVAGFEATGIERRRVATKLMDSYLEQLYLNFFIHCDPHPGNLFVRPLPVDGEDPAKWAPTFPPAQRLPIPYVPNRPFQLVFIDFGMAVAIPEQYRRSFRTYAIGMGTRDAYTIVQSYIEGDILMPDTDLDELEALIEQVLQKFPSAFVGQVREGDFDQYQKLFSSYQSLLFQSPMKLKADLLFIFRAMGVCAGTVTRIDPTFDPAERFVPMVQRLLADEWRPSPDQLKRLVMFMARLPTRLDGMLTRLERGKLTIRVEDANRHKDVRALARATNRLSVAVLFGGLMVSAVLLARSDIGTGGALVLGAVLLAAVAVLRGIR
ncbi:AarF/ABC1/UbiB kinase family protein [Acuticoccus sp. I52.16.1]|uniref:ABC1 kinase family protein n=1 Tax=Acuticoccus sp. I52.16.1 TaxID=2928472 RepID=UPI001FCFF674|nr:AarF/UbiB family protein [Acuticoccus sp. I52.16.1]UOM34317.1 AarF/UbiB family protein [Acuticoccus sp. I52.16.1]